MTDASGSSSGKRRDRRLLALCAALAAGLSFTAAKAQEDGGANPAPPDPGLLRVCADPNNLPFSNARGEGFENKLAELVAAKLGRKVEYVWWAQRRGFIRNTLKAEKCDVIMGVPQLDMLATTQPYYRSTYVLISRADKDLNFSSLAAPELQHLKIGVQLVGDDGANTPPAHALAQQHITENVVGFPLYGDYREDSPPRRIIEAVERGDIDIAAAWGPMAGYFAKVSPVPLKIVPIGDTARFSPQVFEFSISMGVRKGDQALKAELDRFIAENKPEIQDLLSSYGVPLM